MGISTEDLILFFVMLVGFILLLFAFIFVGIAAFSTATNFNSVINSMLPVGSGGGVSKGSSFDEDKLSKGMESSVDGVVGNMSQT